MAKISYIVKTPCGAITRKSHREYTHAVVAMQNGKVIQSSFCGSLALAKQQASREEFTRLDKQGATVQVLKAERSGAKEGTSEKRYLYIRAWGRGLGSFTHYIEREVEQAIADNAPDDAVFKRGDGSWATFSQVKATAAPDTIERIEQFVQQLA